MSGVCRAPDHGRRAPERAVLGGQRPSWTRADVRADRRIRARLSSGLRIAGRPAMAQRDRSDPYFSACRTNRSRRKRSPHGRQEVSCEALSSHSAAESRRWQPSPPTEARRAVFVQQADLCIGVLGVNVRICMHIVRQLQHDAPVPPLDAASAITWTSDPWPQQTSPTGAGPRPTLWRCRSSA